MVGLYKHVDDTDHGAGPPIPQVHHPHPSFAAHFFPEMASNDQKNSSSDLKLDAEKSSSTVDSPSVTVAADAHYDPAFVAKTL